MTHHKITCISLDYESMYKLVYHEGRLRDETLFKRIRYFSSNDFGYYARDIKPFYVILREGRKIIGVAKCGHYSMNSKRKDELSISFFSIDIDYRGKGYARIMCDKLFETAHIHNYRIRTSTYTVLGSKYLKHLFNRYAQKWKVKFLDKQDTRDLIDAKYMYMLWKGVLVHKDELVERGYLKKIK